MMSSSRDSTWKDRLGTACLAASIFGIIVPLFLDMALAGFDTEPKESPILYFLAALHMTCEIAALVAGIFARPSFARSIGLFITGLCLGCWVIFLLLVI